MASRLPALGRVFLQQTIVKRSFHVSAARRDVFTVQDEDDFEKKVLKSDKPVIVDFYADWCGPCRMLLPRIEKVVQAKGDKVHLAKVNIDNNADIAVNYGVSSVPSVISIVDGEVKDKFVGLVDEDRIDTFVERTINFKK